MPPSSLTSARGCGRRVAGGLYLEVPTSPHGQPIEYFLICPPIQPNFDLPTQGQLPFWKGNVLNLVDWIGEGFYPNVCDWIEEARVLGVSSRVSLQFANRDAGNESDLSVLEALTSESRLYFAHRRAYINNIMDYGDPEDEFPWNCPKDIDYHPDFDQKLDDVPCCIGVYWWDLDSGDLIEVPADVEMVAADRLVRRTLPCQATYMGRTRPEGVKPDYRAAIFARFPVVQLALVRGEQDEHLPVRDKLARLNLNLPVLEVDQ